jgi:hypothetical protein
MIDTWVEQTGWIFRYNTLLNGQLLLRVGIHQHALSTEDVPQGASDDMGLPDNAFEEDI